MSKFYNTVLATQDNMSLEESYLNALEASVAMETAYDMLDSGYIVTEGFVDKAKNAMTWVWNKLVELVKKAWEFLKKAKDRIANWFKKHFGTKKAEAAEAPKGTDEKAKAQPAPGMKVNNSTVKDKQPTAAGGSSGSVPETRGSSSAKSTTDSESEKPKSVNAEVVTDEEREVTVKMYSEHSMEQFPKLMASISASLSDLITGLVLHMSNKNDAEFEEVYGRYFKTVNDAKKSSGNALAIFNIAGKGTDKQLMNMLEKIDVTFSISDKNIIMKRLDQYQKTLDQLKTIVTKSKQECEKASAQISAHAREININEKYGNFAKSYSNDFAKLITRLVNGMVKDVNVIVKIVGKTE